LLKHLFRKAHQKLILLVYHCLLIALHVWTLRAMSKNSMKNDITFIILQCCPVAIHYNATTCAIAQCMAIIKSHYYFVLAHPLCVIRVFKRKKTEKKTKKKLILSHVNHTFFMLDPWIGPHTFKHIQCTLGKVFFVMWRKVEFKVQFALNWSLGPWTLV